MSRSCHWVRSCDVASSRVTTPAGVKARRGHAFKRCRARVRPRRAIALALGHRGRAPRPSNSPAAGATRWPRGRRPRRHRVRPAVRRRRSRCQSKDQERCAPLRSMAAKASAPTHSANTSRSAVCAGALPLQPRALTASTHSARTSKHRTKGVTAAAERPWPSAAIAVARSSSSPFSALSTRAATAPDEAAMRKNVAALTEPMAPSLSSPARASTAASPWAASSRSTPSSPSRRRSIAAPSSVMRPVCPSLASP